MFARTGAGTATAKHFGGGSKPAAPSQPHPAVQAASDAVSHLAAQHAASVVHHIAAVHAHGHAGAAPVHPHIAAHPLMHQGVPPALARALHAAAIQQSQLQPTAPNMVWTGTQWVQPGSPADPNFQQQQIQQGYAPGPNTAGNDSIASNGGGNGILGWLMGNL